MIKNALIFNFIALFSGVCFAQGNFQWQVTNNGWANGECQLVSNSIKMTVCQFHVDVEEEAILAPTGSVWSGDPSTLEIYGDFTLANGAAVRSMLLWDGNKILKAKLLDRSKADSAYEAIVDRNRPVVIPHDPAEIAFTGNGTYHFRIYPVAINGSRKIRVLYSVPYAMFFDGPRFQISTIFTSGASAGTSQIPVEINASGEISGKYMIAYGPSKKTVQFGAIYQIPTSSFYQDSFSDWGSFMGRTKRPLTISPDSGFSSLAFTTSIDSGNASGYYSAVFATPPDTILAALKELPVNQSYSLEADINAGKKIYATDFNTTSGYLGVYIKSNAAWDNTVSWKVYNASGDNVFKCVKTYKPQSDSLVKKMLPLVWGAKYSLVEGTGNLGALFGFVDRQMTLLARESDTLNATDRALYAESGVAPLTSRDILVKPTDLPIAPHDNVIFEYGAKVLDASMQNMLSFTVTVKPNRVIALSFNKTKQSSLKAMLFDLSGRLLKTWDRISLNGSTAELLLPANAKGCLILRVFAGADIMQKKFTVTR